MQEIELTQGYKAIVDDEDFERLNKYKWCAHKRWKAYCAVANGGTLLMHRVIMNAPKGMEVDHINHDQLDNRKENLRICTRAENSRNQISRRGVSKYKGVCWNKSREKWEAWIRVSNKNKWLGYYDSQEEAALTYNDAARQYFGQYAKLNEVYVG